jgi:signal peptidase I
MAIEKQHRSEGRFGAAIAAAGQFAVIVTLLMLIKTVAAEAYYVPSGSMQPSLLIGDQLVVSKFPYGYSRYSLPVPLAPASPERLLGRLPDYGDVVVFRLPRDPHQTYVKRVVGLPGDRVQMRAGRLWVNASCWRCAGTAPAQRRTRTAWREPPRAMWRRCRTGASIRSSNLAATATSTTRRCTRSAGRRFS